VPEGIEDQDDKYEDETLLSVPLLLGSGRILFIFICYLLLLFAARMNWDELYQTRVTPWEKGAPAPPLLEWLRKHGALEGEVLVPGCGYGHDVRAIAAASPRSTVVGIDISATALKEALKYSSVGREVFQSADIFAFPPSLQRRFDWVFEHTCFCAIQPDQRHDYIKMAVSALKPEGQLLAIFFLNPWDPGDEIPEGGGPPFGITKEELENLFSPHFTIVQELKPKTAYPGREGREIVRLLRKRRIGG
jgi:SAM-dependent methyltransferase